MPYIERTPMGEMISQADRQKRTGALAARSATCRDLIVNELVLNTAEAFLQPFTSKITLHLTQTIKFTRVMQRSKFIEIVTHGAPIADSVEPQLNTIWAMTDFTEENGATHCVPGSHRWPWEQKPTPEQICQAEMSKGSVFFYTGSVLHNGGAIGLQRRGWA